jgi:ribulose-5-phosphate 4-epimerase/fuculose-1-phosphate aldolase
MSNLDTVIKDLVIANRILAREEVVDAYGHVSIRNPDNPKHFFLSRSVSPELVERDDIVELGLDGQPVRDEKRALYLERFIHAAIYEARPDIHSVVHAHAEDILPFGSRRRRRCVQSSIPAASSAPMCRYGISPTSSATPTCSSPTWTRGATWRNAWPATTSL